MGLLKSSASEWKGKDGGGCQVASPHRQGHTAIAKEHGPRVSLHQNFYRVCYKLLFYCVYKILLI